MKKSVAKIFNPRPGKWGLRGDPYLWIELQKLYQTIPLPCSEDEFMQYFDKFFQEITGHVIDDEDHIFLEEFDFGGMSGGSISPRYWRERGLPTLIDRLNRANKTFE